MMPCHTKSSQLTAYGYDPATKTLRLHFVSGGVYEYEAVPQEAFDAMKCCESIGTFLGTSIKGQYKYRRVEAGGLGQIADHKRRQT
jgi:hypothetical protein